MTWLGMLAIIVALVAAFSFVGARPRGGRPVEGTQLMMAGRVVLVITALAIAWAAFGR